MKDSFINLGKRKRTSWVSYYYDKLIPIQTQLIFKLLAKQVYRAGNFIVKFKLNVIIIVSSQPLWTLKNPKRKDWVDYGANVCWKEHWIDEKSEKTQYLWKEVSLYQVYCWRQVLRGVHCHSWQVTLILLTFY